ncbi:ABC transporter substrate-binding protein [Acidithiobacillus thiooxidans]|uniref:ABC transporter substrate-binding protein n=1 Tax=Acidithiobacillus thiooxidans TaxID=930 RepID=UPI00285F63F1|nr:ABC transporter substrate-binding protein [Acidithiobacillus thiooxidans]MDR7926584.1 ABC transporter substrate-binding protein [Acidithiobacillus thiooxidans]
MNKKILFFIFSVSMQLFPIAALSITINTVTGTGDSPPMNINSLLPIVNNDSLANFQVNQLMFTYVIFINDHLSVDWNRSLAKSIKFEKSNTEVNIKLKRWLWSNGKLISARDLVYGFDIIKNYGLRYPNYGMGGIPYIIKRIKVINSDEVRLYLKHEVNPIWFELNGISQLVPLPFFAWKNYSLEYIVNHQTDPSLLKYSDGPYRLDNFYPGRYLSLKINNHFSGIFPRPNKIIFHMVSSSGVEFWGLKSGNINLGNVPHLLLPARHLVDHLTSCITNGGYGINYIPINFHNSSISFLKNVLVRRALELTINQKKIIKIAYHGFGTPDYSPVPADPYTFLSPEMKLAVMHPESRYSIRKADYFLHKSGWLKNKSGIREKNGKILKFNMMVCSASRTNRIVAEILQDEWRKIGVIVDIKLVPFNVELSNLGNPMKWQTAIIPWVYSPDYYPSGDGLFNTAGGTNYGGYSNPEMDRLIHETTVKNNKLYLFSYQDFAAKNLPVLFLPMPKYLVKYSPVIKLSDINMSLSLVGCGGSTS